MSPLASHHERRRPRRLPLLATLGVAALLLVGAPAWAGDTGRVQVDIREVPLLDLTLFFSDLCEQNFVLLDKDLEGKRITIYAPRAVSVDEACQLFVSAVRMHGLVVEDDGAYWKVTLED